MFALYGERKLSQDDDADIDSLYLVNTYCIENSDGPVEMYVLLEFEHNNYHYQIKRTILGMKDGKKIVHEEIEHILNVTEPSGNTYPIKDKIEIAQAIDNVLDHRVREYFLFDGEKIERLTKANIEQRLEVSKGIKNLLNIDALENSIKALGISKRKLNREIISKSSGELKLTRKLLLENSEKQEQIINQINHIKNDIETANKDLEKINKELKKFEGVSEIIEKRSEYEEQKRAKENELLESQSKMGAQINSYSFLLVDELTDEIYSIINQQKKDGIIPSNIRIELIEQIIESEKCICGNKIVLGSEAFNKIIEWKNITNDNQVQDILLEIWRLLSSIKDNSEDVYKNLQEELGYIINKKDEIDVLSNEIFKLSEDIGNNFRKDITSLEDTRNTIIKDIGRKEEKIDQLSDNKKLLVIEENDLKIKLEKLEKEHGFINELKLREKLTEDIYSALDKTYSQFTENIKMELSDRSTEFLNKILSEHGQKNIKNIKITDNYTLEVLNNYGQSFLANISAGERQIVSISFIIALALLASDNEKLKMPLFMDTPFGRLSFVHRKNLINVIPEEANQWILLATDQEFKIQEADLIKKTNKWANFYTLDQDSNGGTRINKRSINDYRTILNS
jgi:DNA sulfur modification protein DndD